MVRSAVWFSAVHWSSTVSSSRMKRSLGSPSRTISSRIALTSVVLPEPVPPETRMFRRSAIAARSNSACVTVIEPDSM